MRMPMQPRYSRLLVIAAVLALGASACGSSDDTTTTAAPAATTTAAPAATTTAAPAATTTAAPDALEELVAAAEAEGEVNVRSIFNEGLDTGLMVLFEDEYDIKVNYSKVGGSPPTLNAYLTEREGGQNSIDIMQMAEITARTADQSLWAEFSVPNDANYVPGFEVTDQRYHTSAEVGMALVYNDSVISVEDLPPTYEDLADPKYKGLIAMGTPENSVAISELLYLGQQLYGDAWLEGLAANEVLETEREIEAGDFVARGERALAPISHTAAIFQMSQGAPLTFHWVPGTLLDRYGPIIPEDAPHPNAARLFVNWLISQEHQQRMVDTLNTVSPIKGVTPAPGYPSLEELEPNVTDAEVFLDTAREEIVAQWRALAG